MSEIAKVEPADPMMLELLGRPAVWSSMDLAVLENRVTLAQAMMPTAPKLGTVLNTRIIIRDLVLQPMEGINDDDGEVEVYTGITLVCTDGRMFWTGSKGVKKSIHSLFLIYGKPPWKDGAEVTVIQNEFVRKNGQPGRSYYLIPYVQATTKKK